MNMHFDVGTNMYLIDTDMCVGNSSLTQLCYGSSSYTPNVMT